MAISGKLKAFLETSKIKYTIAKHALAYTAQEIAASQHVSGKQLAKCVLVNTDRGPTLAVLPAVHLINLKKLKALLGAKTLTIGKEADIKQRFPDIEVGAMSPFGNLYQVPVAVDRALEGYEDIVCNGGSHTDTIKMRYRDFASLVKPKTGSFGQPISPPASAKKPRSKKAAASKRKRPATTSRASTTLRKKSSARRR